LSHFSGKRSFSRQTSPALSLSGTLSVALSISLSLWLWLWLWLSLSLLLSLSLSLSLSYLTSGPETRIVQVDVDGDGVIDYDEFVMFTCHDSKFSFWK